MNKDSNNISSLDLFRGIAGYGVAICHFYYNIYEINSFQVYSIFFVESFFVLSGFVLYPQLIKIHENSKNLNIFFLRRWYRTIPPYIIALICYSILFKKFDFDTFKYSIFVQKISKDFVNDDYFSVAWSLSVEEYFYLLFPLFLLFLKKNNFQKITIFFIATIYLIKIFYLLVFDDEEFYRTGTFLRLDAIAFGVILRIYYKKINNNTFIFLKNFLLIYLTLYFYDELTQGSNLNIFFFILLLQIISINFIILFINFNHLITLNIFKNFFSLIAKQTYSIYLFHFACIYFIKIFNLSNINHIFIYYIVILFIFSTLFYFFFEKNIINARPNYKYVDK